MVLPACFFFPRASACLILACLSTFFCRPATCFGMFDFGMFKFGHLHAKMRSFRHVSSFRVLRHVCFWPVEALSSVGLRRASACLILACLSLVICMQRCGPSGMFLLSACFGMFAFGMFKRFLLSACDVLRHVGFWHV